MQGQQTWPRRENITTPTPPPAPAILTAPQPAEPLGRESGKDSEMGSPSPILSLSPAQSPEKPAILGGTPVVRFPSLPPSRGSEMPGETELERQNEMQRPKAKEQRDRDRDRRQRWRDRDTETIQRDG